LLRVAILNFLAENLQFMAEPWFAISWYLVGIAGVIWVVYDGRTANSALNPPLKVCWPILIFFFSIIGILLYLVTSRPLDAGRVHGHEAKMRRFTEYSQPRWRKVIASAAHCVGGDGLGIMTGMVFARLWGFTFWQEFWFEYAVGYVLGWFLFQTWAMRRHGHGWFAAIWKGGRAEFFSMLTVMLGMGLVMYWVTPAVVGEQPMPDTYAFWTFGALGLLAGFILTYPMNYWLVSIGWKHGQGHEPMLKKMDAERDRQTRPYRSRASGRQSAYAASQG
jgi:Domain of unknown function (DUF4396)